VQRQVLRSGAIGYLRKPFQEERLIHRVKRIHDQVKKYLLQFCLLGHHVCEAVAQFTLQRYLVTLEFTANKRENLLMRSFTPTGLLSPTSFRNLARMPAITALARWPSSTIRVNSVRTSSRSGSRLASTAERILVDLAVLHDDLEVLGGVGDQVDILQWIAIDKQQIGKCALLHDPELASIRTAFA
jgi:hypothetical protein